MQMTKMKMAINIIAATAIALLLYSCNSNTSGKPAAVKQPPAITAQAFPSGDGWGYAVFVNGKIFIKQSFIPAIEGNESFAKKEDALKVAMLVVTRLKQKEMPEIKLEDLRDIGVLQK
jgi:hypothetical protein